MQTCWGELELALRFADMAFSIRGLNTSQWQTLTRRYASLLTRSDDNDIGMLETWLYRQSLPVTDTQRYSKNGIYTPIVKRHRHSVDIEACGFQAAIVLQPLLRGTLYAEDGDLLATPVVFENYLRILAAYAILLRGGLLLHSAGFVVDGAAYLFLGRSGAGKTTVTRMALAAGAKILSDDINIVVPASDGGFAAGAVPFAGELGHESLEQSGRYPLKGLYWLEKSPVLGCENIAAAGQLAKLLACCPVVNADPHQLDRILGTGALLLNNTPMRLLRFRRDEAFSELRKILCGHGDSA
jgi:hypothetical protein